MAFNILCYNGDIVTEILGEKMNKKTIIPTMLFCVRLVLLTSIIASLCMGAKFLFAVLFIVVAVLDICDVVLAMRNSVRYSLLGIVSSACNRFLYITPLIFLTIYRNITIWVLLILIFFELVIGLYRTFANTTGKKRIICDVVYVVYFVMLWLSIFVNLFFETLGTMFIFLASAVGAIFIIYSSIIVGEDDKQEESDEESREREECEIEKSLKDEEIDEIFE